MRRNTRFHLIALTSICAIITIVYSLMPSGNGSNDEQSDKSIEIFSATWGENCNIQIGQAIENNEATPLTKDASGNIVSPPALTAVKPDNVLLFVSNACNGKLTCAIKASSAVLGVEPYEKCYKNLAVTYRCFSYDRSWNVTADQGKTLTIDCNATSPVPAKS